jgi:hypothetical protein
MVIKKRMKILSIIISLFVIFSLVGCKSAGTDETQIMQIAKNIEEAIEEKDVDLFMENISYNYSDTKGGTYDKDLVDAFSILKIEIKVTIPENDLVLTDIYASGKMNIKISLKACILWTLCTTLYNENTEYNVDFIKENDDWKIISLTEI